MAHSRSITWRQLTGLAERARIYPHSGSFLLDCAYLLFIFVIQTSVVPTFTGIWPMVDMLLPWVLVNAVFSSNAQAIAITLLAAFALETHSSLPAGLYICAFTISTTAICSLRYTLSWRYLFPWIVTFIASEFLVIFSETFALILLGTPEKVDFEYCGRQLIRILVAIAVGVTLARWRLKIERIMTR